MTAVIRYCQRLLQHVCMSSLLILTVWKDSTQDTLHALHAQDPPVLSDRMVCTMPSSSLRLDVRADGGVSVSAWYMRRSLFMNRNACMRSADNQHSLKSGEQGSLLWPLHMLWSKAAAQPARRSCALKMLVELSTTACTALQYVSNMLVPDALDAKAWFTGHETQQKRPHCMGNCSAPL